MTTAVDAVAADLRAAVLAGSPAPGERLVEEVLAARYEVARHTVRAALRVLAAERLVEVMPHRGARVARLDGAQLQALFELRTALEVEAARLAMERAALPAPGRPGPWPADVAAAADRLDALCAAADTDRAAIDEAHLALHHALVAAAGSDRITAVHAGLATEQRLVLLQSREWLDPARMAAHHRELLAGLATEGPQALHAHLEAGRAFTA